MTNTLRNTLIALTTLVLPAILNAQQEGPVPTQALVNVDSKTSVALTAGDLTVTVNNRKETLDAWTPVLPAGAQVALLIDDGLRETVGRELSTLKNFITTLPAGTEILVGYMQNGRVVEASPFTTDHASAAGTLHLPEGLPGASASPYFCVSDFVKKWPTSEIASTRATPAARKARFILMITNGVDLYNGSVSVLNQDSPYVQSAVEDAQRAGVAVYSIYYADAGIRGGAANFSGQSYLNQIAEATGARSFYEGQGNPVSMAPFLADFQRALGETYIATFNATAGKRLVPFKITAQPKAKLHAPQAVEPGNRE